MRTCVVVLGEQGAPGPSTDTSSVHRSAFTSDSEVVLTEVTDEGGLARTLDGGRHVLVLAEQRHAVALGRQSTLLAARGDDVPLAGRALPHGPLAVRLLAEYVADQDVSPAHAVALLDEVAKDTFSAAWVPSVARLSSPSPSLTQHLRSWWPFGAGFLVEHAPVAQVSAVRDRTDKKHRSASAHRPQRTVLFVAGDGAPDRAVQQAQRLAGTQGRRRVPADVIVSADRYGGSAAVQFAALPADLPEPPTESMPPCRVCGVPVSQDACPFCHIRTAPLVLESPS